MSIYKRHFTNRIVLPLWVQEWPVPLTNHHLCNINQDHQLYTHYHYYHYSHCYNNSHHHYFILAAALVVFLYVIVFNCDHSKYVMLILQNAITT